MEIHTPRGTFTISTEPEQMDVGAIHAFLSRSYWAEGRTVESVRAAIRHSLNFGLFDEGGRQVGFARVVTDYATFAWLADVYVLEAHRGLELGKALIGAVVTDERLSGLPRTMLATRDAHGLYEQFGFHELALPDRFMARAAPAGDT